MNNPIVYKVIDSQPCGCETVIVAGKYQKTDCDKHYLTNRGK